MKKWKPFICYGIIICCLYACQKESKPIAIQQAIQCCQTIGKEYQQNNYAVLSENLVTCLDSAILTLERFPTDTSLAYHQAFCYFNRAYYTSILRDNETALYNTKLAEEILENRTDAKSQNLLTDVYNLLSIFYEGAGEIDLSIAYSNKAKERYKTSQKMDLVAIEYTNQAMTWNRAGEYQTAKDAAQQSVDLYKSLKQDHPDNVNFLGAYNALAKAYQGLAMDAKNVGNIPLTKTYFAEVIRLYEYNAKVLYVYRNNPNAAEYYHKTNLNLGVALYHKGQSSEADSTVAILKRAIDGYRALFKEEIIADAAYGMVVLAATLAEQQKFEAAFEWLQKGLNGLGYSSTSVFDNPLIDIENIQQKSLLIESLYLKTRILKAYYKKTKQAQHLILSFEVLENTFQFMDEVIKNIASENSLAGLKNRFYNIYTQTIATAYDCYHITKDKKYLQVAFGYTEKGKSFALRQSLSRKINQLEKQGKTQAFLNKDEALRKAIVAYEQQYFDTSFTATHRQAILDTLFQKKQAYNVFIQDLKQSKDPIAQTYYHERFNHEVPSIESIQNDILDKKTALIEYHLGENGALAFVITATTFQVIPLNHISNIWGKPLNTFKDGLRIALTVREFAESAHILYQSLLADIEKHLEKQSIEKLLIVPDQQLRDIPFEALLKTPSTSQDFNNLPFVLRDYKISYLYALSSQVLLDDLQKKRSKAPFEFAAFVSQYGEDTTNLEEDALADLRCSNRPIRAITHASIHKIAPLFKPASLFYPAFEQSFKDSAQYYNHLLLAMHGCMEEAGNPLTYNLLFSESTSALDDATLMVGEILYEVPLRADLLVLASCNTEKKANLKNDRIATIARAFRHAGAANIIATLNSVNDQTTAKILTYFYQKLQEGYSKDAALQAAKLHYLDTAPNRLNPKFWANLVLIGK